MKWEQYNGMSSEHQKEFDFRFKRERLEMPFSLSSVIIFQSLGISILTAILAIGVVPELTHLRSSTLELLYLTTSLFTIFTFVIIIEAFFYLASEGYLFYKKNRWLKQRGYK